MLSYLTNKIVNKRSIKNTKSIDSRFVIHPHLPKNQLNNSQHKQPLSMLARKNPYSRHQTISRGIDPTKFYLRYLWKEHIIILVILRWQSKHHMWIRQKEREALQLWENVIGRSQRTTKNSNRRFNQYIARGLSDRNRSTSCRIRKWRSIIACSILRQITKRIYLLQQTNRLGRSLRM